MLVIEHRSAGTDQGVALNDSRSSKRIRVELLRNKDARVGNNVGAQVVFDPVIPSAVDRMQFARQGTWIVLNRKTLLVLTPLPCGDQDDRVVAGVAKMGVLDHRVTGPVTEIHAIGEQVAKTAVEDE